MNQAIAVFRPVKSLNFKFLMYWLLSEKLLRLATSQAKAMAGQSNLTPEICRGLPVPLCSLRDQEVIVEKLDKAFGQISAISAQVERNLNLLKRLQT